MPLRASVVRQGSSKQRREDGYTLVALLALMTVLALFALAAAPSIRQQAQREREIETIFRGEEVADAIRALLLLSSQTAEPKRRRRSTYFHRSTP